MRHSAEADWPTQEKVKNVEITCFFRLGTRQKGPGSHTSRWSTTRTARQLQQGGSSALGA